MIAQQVLCDVFAQWSITSKSLILFFFYFIISKPKVSAVLRLIFFVCFCFSAALPSWSTWRRSIRPPCLITGTLPTWSSGPGPMSTCPGSTQTSECTAPKCLCWGWELLPYHDLQLAGFLTQAVSRHMTPTDKLDCSVIDFSRREWQEMTEIASCLLADLQADSQDCAEKHWKHHQWNAHHFAIF